MKVLMVGRRKSVAFRDLQRYWGEVDFAKPPRLPVKRYDLVIAQEPTIRIGVPAYLAARLTGAKLVIEVHGDYLEALSPPQRLVARYLLRRADHVRAVNNSVAEKLASIGVRDILTIPAIYIDTSVFKPLKPHIDRPRNIIYAGRLVREKNLPLLLKIFRRVREEVKDATLTIVGEGPEKPVLRRLAKELGLGDSVKLYPWMPPSSLPRLYSDSAVFALTSSYEGGPRAVFEAGACETPFAAFPVGILREVAEDGRHGLFAEDWKPETLARNLTLLLTHPKLREKMGKELRKLTLKHFEWRKTIKNYAQKYLELAGN